MGETPVTVLDLEDMKTIALVALHLADGGRVRREEEVGGVEGDGEYDAAYNVEDYDEEAAYNVYESSGSDWSIRDAWEPVKNFLGLGQSEIDYYEASTQVEDWWNDFRDDDYKFESEYDVPITRYPVPELNKHGHVDMAELAFRDTLDEYFDIFVIVLSGSILALLGCAAYGRIRNIRYMKKAYGNLDQPKDADEAQNLL